MAILPNLLYEGSYSDYSGTNPDASPLVDRGVGITVRGDMVNESVEHDWYGSPLIGVIDVGSNWFAVKSSFHPDPTEVDVVCKDGFGSFFGYRGPLVVDEGDLIPPESFRILTEGASSGHRLDELSTEAIRRLAPTNPASDLPTAVGELLVDGLPSAIGSDILKRRRLSPVGISNEYANGQFGILPTLSDLHQLSYAFDNSQELINRYAEDANKVTRKRHDFVTELSTDVVEYVGGNHLSPIKFSAVSGYLHDSSPGGNSGVRRDVITTERKRWFKGAFAYTLPPLMEGQSIGNRLRGEIAQARHLFGGINASTVWNLIPYSWAAGWFSNASSILSNLDAFAFDGLLMPWAYMMEEFSVNVERVVSGASLGNQISGAPLQNAITSKLSVVVKQRRRANPFGFGFDGGNLSLRQWSIAGALAISHGFG